MRPVRFALAVIVVLVSSGAVAAAQRGGAPVRDSLFARAQRMANEGDTAGARALADSLVRAAPDGSDTRADALFLRASLARDAADAQRDYRAIIVEHGLSPRAADALLRLGQAEFVRGDRDAARRHLERLTLEHAGSAAAVEGWYWLGRARVDDGDLPGGCAALDSARAGLPPSDIERRNRVSFAAQRCRNLPIAPPAADSAVVKDSVAAKDSVVVRDSVAPKPAPPPAPRWSAQVAAYKTRREAENMVRTLQTRGFEARVDSLALFHVRVGSFARKADATALAAKLKQQRIDAFVVEVIPREP